MTTQTTLVSPSRLRRVLPLSGPSTSKEEMCITGVRGNHHLLSGNDISEIQDRKEDSEERAVGGSSPRPMEVSG